MAQAKRGWCAIGLVLLAAAGCTLPESLGLNFLQQTGPGGERVVAGSLDSVSQSTQATLRRLGMSAVVTQEGASVRISSKTTSGADFDLVLTRMLTDQGERTKIRMEWKKGSDEQTGFLILGQLETLGAQK